MIPRTARHGTRSMYVDYFCRCDLCTQANTDYHKRRRHERAGQMRPGIQHGTKSTYANWGCRCQPCTAANSEATRMFKARRKEAVQ